MTAKEGVARNGIGHTSLVEQGGGTRVVGILCQSIGNQQTQRSVKPPLFSTGGAAPPSGTKAQNRTSAWLHFLTII